ncbi:MAG: nucleoside deaminase [Candidatus Moraniibacteriota bacterium]|jgi:guanine deaminase
MQKNKNHEYFMKEAIKLSLKGMQNDDGGPFGAVVVKNNEIIAKGNNEVTSQNDPTMHAEIVAIRNACKTLSTFDLSDCILYTSCEPCPMCLGAVYWSRFERVYYANTKEDAANIEFDDEFIYEELELTKENRKLPMEQLMRNDAIEVFKKWEEKSDKIKY